MGASIGVFGIIKVFSKIVLVRHAYGEQKLSLPGGGLETGETPDIAVQRESFEETGLRVSFEHIGTFFLRKSPGCVYLFFGEAESLPENIGADPQEIKEALLADPNDLPKDVYPAQRRLIERWMMGDLGNCGSYSFNLL